MADIIAEKMDRRAGRSAAAKSEPRRDDASAAWLRGYDDRRAIRDSTIRWVLDEAKRLGFDVSDGAAVEGPEHESLSHRVSNAIRDETTRFRQRRGY